MWEEGINGLGVSHIMKGSNHREEGRVKRVNQEEFLRDDKCQLRTGLQHHKKEFSE